MNDASDPVDRLSLGVVSLRAALPNGPQAVIFDMDGTLLDTERLNQSAKDAAAKALGVEISAELHLAMVGVHRDWSRDTLAAHFGPSFDVDLFYEASDVEFKRLSNRGIPHQTGVVAIVDHLRACSIPMAVATSTASPRAQLHLASAGLLDRFATIVTRSDVDNPKPAPDPYLLAARRLNVEPRHCLAVEDSPNGARSAAAAGMPVAMIPDLIQPDIEARALSTAIFDDLADLLLAIRQLQAWPHPRLLADD